MKNVFSIFCFSIGCFVFSNTVYAENIVPYSDGVISFSYDSDFKGAISLYNLPSNYSFCAEYRAAFDTYSNADSPDGFFVVRVGSIQKVSEMYNDWKDIVPLTPDALKECESVDVISSGDLPESLIHMDSSEDGKYTFYRKLLGYNDKYLVIADYHLSSTDSKYDSFFETLYDSVQVTDDFLGNNFVPSGNSEYSIIFSNAVYSDQVLNYAKELIRIGHDYLDFSLSSDDAYDRLQEVQERLSNYLSLIHIYLSPGLLLPCLIFSTFPGSPGSS